LIDEEAIKERVIFRRVEDVKDIPNYFCIIFVK